MPEQNIIDYPQPRDVEAWRELFSTMPEAVRLALWKHAPTAWPGHPESVAWAVIAYYEAVKSATRRNHNS